MDIAGGEIERGQAIGIDPNPHGDLPFTFECDPLDPGQCSQLRLQGAQKPIGDGWNRTLLRAEAQIKRGIGTIRPLDFNRSRFGFRRQFRPHLLQACRDFGQGRGAAVVQFQVDGHGADTGPTGRFDVIDATDRRDHSFDRGTDKPTNGFGTGSVVDGRDHHQGVLDRGILLDRERGQCLPSREENHQVDDDGQDRVDDEDISEGLMGHRLSHGRSDRDSWT